MKILVVHQNFPGQFKHLVPELLKNPVNEIVAFTMNEAKGPPKLNIVRYKASRPTTKGIHPWVAEIETKVIRGEAAYHAAKKLLSEGFTPDLILAHPGWGESLFLKQVWPKAKLLIYCEFHYDEHGMDYGFDSEFPATDEDDACRVRLKNVNNFLHFDIAEGGISPTEWQKSTFPEPFRSKIHVVHDGIDTDVIKPNPNVILKLGDRELTRNDEIITFVNRNLEPYRGYHIFMRALPKILRERPNARVILVGGDKVSYGAPAPEGNSWRNIFLNEIKDQIDLSRVYFIGQIPYQNFISLLQTSTIHVYLTYPFVLSWSLLEAMACGCAIVASDTAPLKEAIIDGETGILTPFFEPLTLANHVIDLLNNPAKRAQLSKQAREFAVKHYDLKQVCLPRLVDVINSYA